MKGLDEWAAGPPRKVRSHQGGGKLWADCRGSRIIGMNSDGSVTQWISRLKGGEASAAGQLWRAYFPRLVGLARRKLGPRARRLADEEDVALSAFKSLCLGAAGGRFPQLCRPRQPLAAVGRADRPQGPRPDQVRAAAEARRRIAGAALGRGTRRHPVGAQPRADARVCRHGGGELRGAAGTPGARAASKSPSGNSTATPTARLPSGWAADCGPSSGGWS